MSNSIKKTASGALVFIIGFLFGLLMSIYGLKVCLATLGNHWDVQLWAMIFSLPIIGFIAVRSGILFIDMDNGRFNSNTWPINKSIVFLLLLLLSFVLIFYC